MEGVVVVKEREFIQYLGLCCAAATAAKLLQSCPTLCDPLDRIRYFQQIRLNSTCPAAAAAKSLQSCSTLCDPTDGSTPGSSVPGILQARMLEWVAISFSNACKWKGKVKSLTSVQLLATPWTAAYQAPPSMGFSRQEYRSGVPLRSLTVRTGHEKTDWFQIGKGAHQGCILSPCLTSMQSTSWETLGWKKHKLESRLPGEISITSDMQMTLPLWQKVKRN